MPTMPCRAEGQPESDSFIQSRTAIYSMSRELKFRIYHKGRKAWLHDTEHAISLFGETIMFGEIWRMPDDSGIPISEMNECIAMQFTGLRDKNGKEIYEGDIIKWYTDSMWKFGKLYYGDAGWEIEWLKSDPAWDRQIEREYIFKVQSFWPLSDDRYIQDSKLEVIGNIYEHPELLK